MKHRVVVTPAAQKDLRAAYNYIRRDSQKHAAIWIRGIRSKISSRSRWPERAALAPESHILDEPIHEIFFGSGNRGTYRIMFMVLDDVVFILHVRHGSQDAVRMEKG